MVKRMRAFSIALVYALALTGTVWAGECHVKTTSTSPLTLVAHRGWLDPAGAENSLPQMKETLNAGITMVEIDLRRSKDGTIYLLHDASLDRTTTGIGAIAETTDARLATVRVLAASGTPTDESLTKFDEVLKWAQAESKVHLMLDIKAVDPIDLLRLLVKHRLDARSVILTFDGTNAAKAFSLKHKATVSVLVKSEADIADYISNSTGHNLALYVPQEADISLFEAAKKTGFPVITDAVVDAPAGPLDDRAEALGSQIYRDYLTARPIDYFVSNYALKVRDAVCPF